ncbi:MAG: acetoacetate decarboxylase family protein [Deltaproteobacteria bacterium]|nr:acetoacetate decarboxylase family protein [Deltaproteobacteria bacterium]
MANTRWIKTPQEIQTIEERLAHPAFLDGETLTVTYLTRPELVRAVLPPPLEPAGEPLVAVGVGSFGRSNCVGAFAGGWVDVRARYQGIEANYCLAMPMSTDVAIIFGRELFGEPKKQGKVRLESDGDVTRGVVERYGIPYLLVEARLTENLPIEGPATSDRFHFKFMHSADGRGLEFDPIIVHAHFETQLRVVKRGPGKAAFKPSHHDPLSDLEIVEFRGAVYSEGDVYAHARRIGTVDAKSFLPYAFQNIDDYSGEI